MIDTRHGFSIGIEHAGNDFFLFFKAVGTLTHADYERITPLIDAALQGVKDPKIKALFDVTELDGWEPRAAWDDFRIGLAHGSAFERIAIFGNRGWQAWMAKIGAWFVSGEVRFFEQRAAAEEWLLG
jgi:hypothetical protein